LDRKKNKKPHEWELAGRPETIKFGWDPIFVTEGHTKTWAELTDDEKHEVSPRKDALEKIKEYLDSKN